MIVQLLSGGNANVTVAKQPGNKQSMVAKKPRQKS